MLAACRAVRETPGVGSGVRCPVGAAVVIPAFGELLGTYAAVAHTVPPAYDDAEWERRTVQCYRSALDVAWGYGTSHRPGDGAYSHEHAHIDEQPPALTTSTTKSKLNSRGDGEGTATTHGDEGGGDPWLDKVLGTVAMPLLGAGARGVPARVAAKAAAEAVADYTPPPHLMRRVARGESLHLSEEAPTLYGAKFSVRFAVPAGEAAQELEQALEVHLGQCYVPLSMLTGKYQMLAPPVRETATRPLMDPIKWQRRIDKRRAREQQECFLYRLTGTWSGYSEDTAAQSRGFGLSGGKGEGPWSSALYTHDEDQAHARDLQRASTVLTGHQRKRELKMIKAEDRGRTFLYRLTGCWSGGRGGAWQPLPLDR